MQELIGKKVRITTGEIEYRGILVEIGEVDIHLEAESGWLVIPVGNVAGIEAVEE